MIMRESAAVSGEWLFYLNGQLIRREKNLIVQSGLNYIAKLLVNESTNNISMHLALGTGSTAPVNTNIKLEAEVNREPVSAKTRQANMGRLRTFFQASEVIGTWYEFGIFLAGTENKDSGTLLSRVTPPGGISKASNTVLTIEVRITFSAG